MKSGNYKNVEAEFIKLRHIRDHVLICFHVYAKYAQFARRKQTVITWRSKTTSMSLPSSCGCLCVLFKGGSYAVRI
jgi:hypothetical protein